MEKDNKEKLLISCWSKFLYGWIISVLFLSIPVLCSAQEGQTLRELQVKSAYLYNFTKFIYWNPNPDTTSSKSFTIGLVQADEIANLLEEYTNSGLSQSNIQIRKLDSIDSDYTGCQLIYIDSSQKNQVPYLLETLKGMKVLTVSDILDFAKEGGMIGFALEKGKIRIEMNLSEITKAGLKVSAKLIEVSRIIK